MRRKTLIGLVSGAVLFGGALAVGAGKNDDAAKIMDQKKDFITAQQAKGAALAKQDGFIESIELEDKTGKPYYEVEVKQGGKEYKFHIDAVSGDILFSKMRHEDDSAARGDDRKKSNNELNAAANDMLTAEDAIAIAEKAVNGKVKEFKRDHKDGQMVFEIELSTDKGKAEVKVDAGTGKILKVEYDD